LVISSINQEVHKWTFKGVFGRDSVDSFFIVYGLMKRRPSFTEKGDPMEWPYYKPGTDKAFNVSSIVSFAETKSAKYLSETFGEFVSATPKLISDYEIKEKLDISFCSIGGFNNSKTVDVLRSDENTFFDFDLTHPGSIFVKGNREKRFSIDGTYDYALIIKIIPESFPKRVWIAVAGLGEWGTSGAAWFISRKWKKMGKNKSFGIIVKVRTGQDESAEMVHRMTKE